MNYKEYLAYIADAQHYESAEALRMDHGFPFTCEFTADGLVKAFEIIYAVSREDFSKLVELSGGNLSAMCRVLNIPFRTAQNWLLGARKPPAYIIEFIGYALISQCEKEDNL